MLLTTEVHGSRLRGELTRPEHFTEENDGSFIDVTSPIVTRPLLGRSHNGTIAVRMGELGNIDQVSMVLLDPNHLSLDNFHRVVPPWKFERVQSGEQVKLKTDWPAINMDPQFVVIRERLQIEADRDKAAREKEHFDDEELTRLEMDALPLLNEIFTAYGWPTVTVFGAQASANYWILVQHQKPETQQRMLRSMEDAVSAGEAKKLDYAYLFDRVQISMGKPQHWGTQSKCEFGHAILYPIDAALTEVDSRRKAIGLAPLSGKESESLCQHASH